MSAMDCSFLISTSKPSLEFAANLLVIVVYESGYISIIRSIFLDQCRRIRSEISPYRIIHHASTNVSLQLNILNMQTHSVQLLQAG